MKKIGEKEYPTVSDLKPPSAIEGNYKKLSDLVGQELLIQGVKSLGRKPTPKGELVETAVVKARTPDGALVFFYTSHTVVLSKLVYCFEQSPGGFVAKVIKTGRYYDIQ
jgi:hypothetical protein